MIVTTPDPSPSIPLRLLVGGSELDDRAALVDEARTVAEELGAVGLRRRLDAIAGSRVAG